MAENEKRVSEELSETRQTPSSRAPVEAVTRSRSVQSWLKRLFPPGDTHTENAVFLTLILIGAAVRLIALGDIPAGLHQDEAGIGYDAYAVLKYGIDRHGYRNPVHFVSWGSGQNALYGYFSMPFIAAMGLNILSIRSAQALLGVVSLVVIYAIGRRLVDGRFALFATFVLTISPWHIAMSRWGLESNLLPTLLLFSFAFLLRGLSTAHSIIPAFFLLSLSLYAYGTAYFFVPLFTLGVLLVAIKCRLANFRHYGIGLVAMVVTAIPIGLVVAINSFKWEAIETPLFSMPRYTMRARFAEVAAFFNADFFARIWHNSKSLLFFLAEGYDGLIYNALPEFGYFYRYGILISLVGACFLVRDTAKVLRPENLLVLLWLVVALLTSITTDPNINRSNCIFFPLLLCAAYGLYTAFDSGYGSMAKILGVIALAYLTISFAGFTNAYFGDYRYQKMPYFAPSYDEALAHIAHHADQGETIYLTGTEHYSHALFYARPVPPCVGWKRFDRYAFGIDAEARQKGNAFLIANRELPFFPPSDFIAVEFRYFSAVYRRR